MTPEEIAIRTKLDGLPKSQSDARSVGSKYYFAKPCSKGHLSPRYTSTRGCKQCLAERQDAAYWSEYERKNPVKDKAVKQRHYQDNKQEYIKRAAEWARENKDKRRVSVNLWRSKNRDWCAINRAERERFIRDATPQWADHNKIKAIYLAAKAATDTTGVIHSVDHIIPLRGQLVCGLHIHSNMQVLTASENSRKSNRYSVS